MADGYALRVLRSYVIALIATVIFPIQWARSFALAKRHSDDDPRGTMKVAAGIVIGIALAAGAGYACYTFTEAATDGMYETLGERLSLASLNVDWEEQDGIRAASDISIPIIQGRLDEARRIGDNETATELEAVLVEAEKTRSDAVARMAELQPHRDLYVNQLTPMVAARDDAGINQAIATFNANWQGAASDLIDTERVAGQFAIKDDAVNDMNWLMNWFIWPSIIGIFYAPLAIVLGNILGKAWRPSETVGFKKYPGASAGYFLLLGALGAPSIPFAAWVFSDMELRSEEGQISL